MSKTLVYLVPGFFGFAQLGDLNYFRGVTNQLRASLAARGVEAEIVGCATQPTGSIPRRAARLLGRVVETGGLEADTLHFVGHSTGGLDVRLLLSPGAQISDDGREQEIAPRTRTVTCLSTPHHGTPLATFFATLQGRRLLLLLAALASSPQGRVSLYLAGQLVSVLAQADDVVGRTDTLLDHLTRRLLRDLSSERQSAVWEYLRDIASDQGAILQLTPESMHLFAAAAGDDPNVSYGCVVASAPQPPFAYRPRELASARGLLMSAVFTFMHTLTARPHAHYPYPAVSETVRSAIEAGVRVTLTPRTNDGVVPARSQLHGRLLHAARGDHLDIVGQFLDPEDPLSNWLPSGSHFGVRDFEAVWDAVAAHIAGA